jgi:hypothetical protein
MQGESQLELNSYKCLGKAEFDSKYLKLVHLLHLALFILKQKLS